MNSFIETSSRFFYFFILFISIILIINGMLALAKRGYHYKRLKETMTDKEIRRGALVAIIISIILLILSILAIFIFPEYFPAIP